MTKVQTVGLVGTVLGVRLLPLFVPGVAICVAGGVSHHPAVAFVGLGLAVASMLLFVAPLPLVLYGGVQKWTTGRGDVLGPPRSLGFSKLAWSLAWGGDREDR
ncbi:hypothetical protein [Motilibacter rhizosphaerae]|uniref:hypothetical protein n=1 Tax=Motilibacter rhizosphaerae TaxID=598652 RepID=UPI00102B6C01|nr:hypothetical protein [Motilibacter rhizosphaerae]